MSILDRDKVDGIGKNEEENKIALLIADHLNWDNEIEHLTLIQDKINAYISFIESGQAYNIYEDIKVIEGYIIDLRFKYKPSLNFYKLLDVFKSSTKDLAVEFRIHES
ncbi:DUF6572 domain-containing protein [Paenibacillus shenyangensis]|uniref:DUF6572 domain-containing protein n=1 Tax=Paenibacillus sp. A9 TaxID=1284352 RepID=UPI000380E672|nr:DUF6572 domain-containing protein [Paenibacillus sp. A9]